jgi:hypothetical protein
MSPSVESLCLGVAALAAFGVIAVWSPAASAQLVSRISPGHRPFGYCAADETPSFTAGFAQLKAELGPIMGDPVECAHADDIYARGGISQGTTAGIVVYLPEQNVSSFFLPDMSEHWALTEEGVVYWSGSTYGVWPPPRRDPGTLLFQAGWSSDPSEQPVIGTGGWKTRSGMLVNAGTSSAVDVTYIAPPHGRLFALEAQIQGEPSTGAFGVYRRRPDATYRLAYTAGKLLLVSDRRIDGLAPGPLLEARALASVDFDPGTDWHTYRFEATRTHFRALVDGQLMLEFEDDRFPGDIDTGVWTDGAEVLVRDFRLLEL